MKLKTAEPGSVSHATMRHEHLLSAFIATLEGLQMINGDFLALPENHALRDRVAAAIGEAQDALTGVFDEEEAFVMGSAIDTLFDALNEFAPEGHSFSSHPGDGSDYGFWQHEDDECGDADEEEAEKQPAPYTKSVCLAEGFFSWPANERVSDRYGLCGIMDENEKCVRFADKLTLDEHSCVGKGMLIAEVVERIQSQHIGDLFHGLYPPSVEHGEGPKVGERVVLSELGTVIVQDEGEGRCCWIGVEPDNERDAFWMNPVAFYSISQFRVKLILVADPPQEWLEGMPTWLA